MADGAFWNQPMTTEDWDRPQLPHDGGLALDPRPRPTAETGMSASAWLGLQHERGFPKNPG